MKKGLATSELWMTTLPGLAILAHGATTASEWQVRAVCYAGVAALAIVYALTRTKTKIANGANGGGGAT